VTTAISKIIVNTFFLRDITEKILNIFEANFLGRINSLCTYIILRHFDTFYNPIHTTILSSGQINHEYVKYATMSFEFEREIGTPIIVEPGINAAHLGKHYAALQTCV